MLQKKKLRSSTLLIALAVSACAPAGPIPKASGEDVGDLAEGPPRPRPFALATPQAAADIVQTWVAYLEAGRLSEAQEQWTAPLQAESLAKRLNQAPEWHAQVGAPGPISEAAGSLYVSVPIRIYGRRSDGASFDLRGAATLRRSDAVAGSTSIESRWRIEKIELHEGA